MPESQNIVCLVGVTDPFEPFPSRRAAIFSNKYDFLNTVGILSLNRLFCSRRCLSENDLRPSLFLRDLLAVFESAPVWPIWPGAMANGMFSIKTTSKCRQMAKLMVFRRFKLYLGVTPVKKCFRVGVL